MAASVSAGGFSTPKLKDFVFTEKLGSGTYATVYKAYRKGGPRQVLAIKCVKKSSLNKVSTENLLTEIQLLKTLKHEHIVQLTDFQWDDQCIYLMMEYCSGGDLSQFIKTHRTLSEYHAKKFLQQLGSALDYMRSKNVSHMDLKPQNILLTSKQNPTLKVGDFGFAQYLQGDMAASHLRGSPLYMAPEIVIRRHYNEKADLWSVGVILYECLFGKAPFHSQSFKELEDKIKDTKPIELPYGVQISDKCRHLLHGLLQRDPDKRFTFHEFFHHSFIDLDHIPSSQSLERAISLAERAVKADSKQNHKSAINLYCQALEYFVPAIHYESDSNRKEAMRKKVQEYMDRAEELKELMKPSHHTNTNHDTTTPSHHPPYHDLVLVSGDSPPIQAALRVIQTAEEKEEMEDYVVALEKYQLALGALIKVLQEEPKGKRRDLLQKYVSEWMSRAEEVKSYIDVQQLSTQDTSSVEEEENKKLMMGQCSIQ